MNTNRIIISIIFLVILGTIGLGNLPDDYRVPFVILISAALATLGWLYGDLGDRKLSRFHNTWSAIQEFRSSIHYEWHRRHITKFFDHKNPMTKQAFQLLRLHYDNQWKAFRNNHKTNHHIIDSQIIVANWYEFVCAAMINGDLDEKIIKQTLQSIMKNYYQTILPLILFYQERELGEQPKTTSFESFTEVIENRWGHKYFDTPNLRKSLRSARDYIRNANMQMRAQSHE